MAAAPGTGAVSFAAVNSVGKAGGFLGPVSFGLLVHATGSYVPSILLVSAVLVAGGAMALGYQGERLGPAAGRGYHKLLGTAGASATAGSSAAQQELASIHLPGSTQSKTNS
jgi:hypothetical protein